MKQEVWAINYPDLIYEEEPTTYPCPVCGGMCKDATDDVCLCCNDYGRVVCIPYIK